MTIDSPLVSHENRTAIRDATLELDVAGVIQCDKGTFFSVISASGAADTDDTDTAALLVEKLGNEKSYRVQTPRKGPEADEFYTLEPEHPVSEPHAMSEVSIKGGALTSIQQITRSATELVSSNPKTRDTISCILRRTVKHISSDKENSA